MNDVAQCTAPFLRGLAATIVATTVLVLSLAVFAERGRLTSIGFKYQELEAAAEFVEPAPGAPLVVAFDYISGPGDPPWPQARVVG